MRHIINRTNGISNCVCVYVGIYLPLLFLISLSQNWDYVDSLRPSLRKTNFDLTNTLNTMTAGDLTRCVARASVAIELI